MRDRGYACSDIAHIGLRSIRYSIAFFLLLLCGIFAATALAQDDHTNAAAQCAIPPTNFWPLPKSDADAIPVNVEFFLFDIVNINDKDGQFKLDFVLALSWQDSRLEFPAGDSDHCTSRLSDIWHPYFIFVNSAEPVDEYTGLVDIYPDGRVTYSKRFTTHFTMEPDLRRFPFDKQNLTVELASLFYGPDDVTFIADESAIGVLQSAAISGWRLGELRSIIPDRPILALNTSYANLNYSISVERVSRFYVWRLIFPLAMITLMSWCVFWLTPSQLTIQVSVATAAVFSLMAFLVGQREYLPTVSYLSIADKLIVSCVILVFVSFGESIVTGTLAQNDRIQLARSIDRIGRWAYLLLVIFTLTLALW